MTILVIGMLNGLLHTHNKHLLLKHHTAVCAVASGGKMGQPGHFLTSGISQTSFLSLGYNMQHMPAWSKMISSLIRKYLSVVKVYMLPVTHLGTVALAAGVSGVNLTGR